MARNEHMRYIPLTRGGELVEITDTSHGIQPSELISLIQSTSTIKSLEEEGDFWTKMTTPLKHYEYYFRAFGDKECRLPISHFLQNKVQKGTETFALDIPGGKGQALRDMAFAGLISGGINVNLTDLRNEEEVAFDEQHNIHVVTGDVLRASTWNKVEDKVRELNAEATVDLVTCLPLGALQTERSKKTPEGYRYHIPPNIYHLLLRRMLTLLTHNDGLLFTQVPWNVPRSTARDYVSSLNSYPGLNSKYSKNSETWYDNGMLKISKNAQTQFNVI